MKYIRTKEHIYKRLFIDRAIINECGYGACDKKLNPIGETIIKQAETIKELCDELIIKNPNNDGDFYRKVFVYEGAWKNILNEKHAKHCTNRDIYEHDVEIFGAIWVIDSNGVPTLKPVAKMNSKGELELL